MDIPERRDRHDEVIILHIPLDYARNIPRRMFLFRLNDSFWGAIRRMWCVRFRVVDEFGILRRCIMDVHAENGGVRLGRFGRSVNART
jgi:hypothetical protein